MAQDVAERLAESGLAVVSTEAEMVGGECPTGRACRAT